GYQLQVVRNSGLFKFCYPTVLSAAITAL
ncbi:hypothetical protein A2U01_0054337, partial [Trifolium medium]|nr:hypothetical protein [Trifolium medium]